MIIRPTTRDEVNAFLRANHRHNGPVVGYRFGVALVDDAGMLCGVAVAGRPVARMLDDGWTVEITRVCTNGIRNGCSRLYGALVQAAKALGFRRVVTYTRADEPGASVRSAGFRRDGEVRAEAWTRPSRKRGLAAEVTPRIRWVWP